MLEILAVIGLSKKIAAMAKDRGLAGWPFVILFIFLWFGGEVAGAVAGVIILGDPNEGFNIGVYLCAIAGAVIGACLAFAIVAVIPKSPNYGDGFDQPRRRAIDEDDDFDRPIRPRDQQGLDDPRFRDRPS